MSTRRRCGWAKSPLMIEYHDREWGVPVHDDRLLFEFLILEGAQAGLSWETVLKKRDNYREAFDDFDAKRIARYSTKRQATLMLNQGIIRNRLKIAATVVNAKAFLKVQDEFGSFDKFIWQFVGGKALRIKHKNIPARTVESDVMSKELRQRGFKFVGSTICYAFMQAVGLVNDHTPECFRHRQIK